MLFRFAAYSEGVRCSAWNSRQLGSANSVLWTRCGGRRVSGERDSPAPVRGIGAVLAQRMGMALRSGSAGLAVRCRGRGGRRRRRGRDRAGAGSFRSALLPTATRLLPPAELLRTAGLLLRAAAVSNQRRSRLAITWLVF